MDGDPRDPVVAGQGWRERTGDGEDVRNVDVEGGGLRPLVNVVVVVVDTVGDDHGEDSSVLAEVGVGEDEARGGRVLDSRPDKLLDRGPPADCRWLPACPSFLLPHIFPELLQSCKCNNGELSLFQLGGEK